MKRLLAVFALMCLLPAVSALADGRHGGWGASYRHGSSWSGGWGGHGWSGRYYSRPYYHSNYWHARPSYSFSFGWSRPYYYTSTYYAPTYYAPTYCAPTYYYSPPVIVERPYCPPVYRYSPPAYYYDYRPSGWSFSFSYCR